MIHRLRFSDNNVTIISFTERLGTWRPTRLTNSGSELRIVTANLTLVKLRKSRSLTHLAFLDHQKSQRSQTTARPP